MEPWTHAIYHPREILNKRITIMQHTECYYICGFLMFNPVEPPNNSIDFNGFNYPNLVGIATDAFNDTVAAYNKTFSDQVQCTEMRFILCKSC